MFAFLYIPFSGSLLFHHWWEWLPVTFTCLPSLPPPPTAPHTHAASEPPNSLGSAFTGFWPTLGAVGVARRTGAVTALAWLCTLAVLTRCSWGQKSPGPHSTDSRILADFHGGFHTVHCRLSGVQMLGHRQPAGKPGADYRLLPDSKERRSRSLTKILDLYWHMGKVGRHLIY